MIVTRCIVLACAAFLSTVVSAQNPAGPPVVFFTIFGPPGSNLQRFYTEVFGWEIAPDGNATTKVISPLGATIGPSEAAETIVYVGVDDINAALEKVTANGGTIRYPRFQVPGRVILAIFNDPAGNSVGLVEMENGAAKVPPMPAAPAAADAVTTPASPAAPATPAGANP